MKFVSTLENLAQALELVSPLAGKQNTLPILNNVIIKAVGSQVTVCTTNLETAIVTTLRARVEKEGSFTVPAKTISDYIHLLTNEQVKINLEENELVISCGTSSTKIKGSPSDEYPVIPEIEKGKPYLLEASEFKKSLSKTVIAVAKNEIRQELSGVFFNFFGERHKGLVMAATDSYRLTETKTSIKSEGESISCIVPARVVYEIIRLLGIIKTDDQQELVKLWVSDNQIVINYKLFELSARLVDGFYPDYIQIIPKEFKTTLNIPIDILVNKIKAASLFSTVGVNAVSFDLNASENTMNISSTSTQTGEHVSEIDIDIVGEENSILLNHKYVLDGLQQIQTDMVEFGVNSGDTPCIFRPQGEDDYLYIVMPIRQ